MAAGERGAYGFRLVLPDADGPLPDLLELDSNAPVATVTWRIASMAASQEHVDDQRVIYGFARGSGFEVRRDSGSIILYLQEPPNRDALVHPMLTVPISVLARWRGDVTLHAGAFSTSAGSWAVVGEREAGKSTFLATLSLHGCPVVADDLVAAQEGWVWSGPRCIDLRPDAAEHLGSARHLGQVGGRPRYRLSTPPGDVRTRLQGLFLLGWHDRPGVAIERLPAADYLKLLYRQEYIALLGPAEPTKLLDLMELPAWRITRPRDWAATDEAVERVLEIASGQA